MEKRENKNYSIVQRTKKRGIYTWYARIYNIETRKTRFVSLGTSKKGVANALLSQRIASGEFDDVGSEKTTFRIAIEKFLHKCELNNLTEGTLLIYRTSLDYLSEFLSDEVTDVSSEDVVNAFNDRFGEMANKTFNVRRVICSSFYTFMIDDLNINVKNPFRKLKSRKSIPKFQKSFWTLEQIKQILDKAPSPHHRMYWAFMAYAGLRRNEALHVKRADLHDGRVYVLGKGKKEAYVPICGLLQSELDKYTGEFDFSNTHDVHGLKTAVKKSGLPSDNGANFHRLRHSFGSNLIRAGANVKAVQLLMRHANIQTTLNIYAHLLDEDLFASVNLLK